MRTKYYMSSGILSPLEIKRLTISVGNISDLSKVVGVEEKIKINLLKDNFNSKLYKPCNVSDMGVMAMEDKYVITTYDDKVKTVYAFDDPLDAYEKFISNDVKGYTFLSILVAGNKSSIYELSEEESRRNLKFSQIIKKYEKVKLEVPDDMSREEFIRLQYTKDIASSLTVFISEVKERFPRDIDFKFSVAALGNDDKVLASVNNITEEFELIEEIGNLLKTEDIKNLCVYLSDISDVDPVLSCEFPIVKLECDK